MQCDEVLPVGCVCMCYHMSLMCCHVFNVCVCDDDCAGLLIRDMDRLLHLIGSISLTLPLPLPYKVLYRYENMTEELKVNTNLQNVLLN